jgi:hypothetical protein
VVDLATAIQNCCLNNLIVDEDEGHARKKSKKLGGGLREKTYLVVSYKTIAGSTTTLVHLLEKVIPEILKLVQCLPLGLRSPSDFDEIGLQVTSINSTRLC